LLFICPNSTDEQMKSDFLFVPSQNKLDIKFEVVFVKYCRLFSKLNAQPVPCAGDATWKKGELHDIGSECNIGRTGVDEQLAC
jgi:hypothetical protein